jgi:ribonuclease BN (tRNA processing enzyme)
MPAGEHSPVAASTAQAVPERLDDKQLLFDHALAHALFQRKSETPEAVNEWNIEDLVDYHSLLVSEIGRRGLKHAVNDDLDGIPVNAVTIQGLRNTAEQIAAKSLYLPAPAAERVWKGEKTLIIKGRSYSGMLNKALYFGDVHKIYGILKLTDVCAIKDHDFQKSSGKHCLTSDERHKFWPENTVLYAYTFEILCKFDKPLDHEYPRGVKVFFPTPKWINNCADFTVAVDLDTAVANMDPSLPLPERFLQAEIAPGVRETLSEISKSCNVLLYTERDSRYFELSYKWVKKNSIPHTAFVVGNVAADVNLTNMTAFSPGLLHDLSGQKSFIAKTSADSADFPQNFFPGRLTEGILTGSANPDNYPPNLKNMVNVDNYDPHKLQSITLLQDHLEVHRWWGQIQNGQSFRFDAATVRELHDAIMRELDARGLPPHQSPIVKADGYSIAPGGIVGVMNMGGGEATSPADNPTFKEPSPLQYMHTLLPSHRKDPKTGKILPPERKPVNPIHKSDQWNIRFLGTAGSQETENRHNSSIIYEEAGTDIIIDLGSADLVGKIMTKLTAALVTHGHPDHTASLHLLDKAVPIYMHRETWRDLLQHLPEISETLLNREIILVDTNDPIGISDTVQACWLPVEHHEEFNTYAILIQGNVLYSPDFSKLPNEYLDQVKTWIVDGNMLVTDEDPQKPVSDVQPVDAPKLHSGHQSVLSSLKQAQTMKVPRVVVTHFSAQNDKVKPENMTTLLANVALEAGYSGDVLAAGDGFVLPGGASP